MVFLKRAVFVLIVALFVGAAAFADTDVAAAASDDCCDDEITVDADDAYDRSQRPDRDPVEGHWAVYIEWHPELDTSRRYRIAIVRNTYGVFEDAEYIGVATCAQTGCKKGEVKLLLNATETPNEFDARMVTNEGFGRGMAILTPDSDGRPNSAIDMRDVKYDGHTMTKWFVRVMDS